MMAKTSKGDDVREYFLRCEREATEGRFRGIVAGQMSDDELMSRALVVAHATIAKVEQRAITAETVAEDRRPAQEWADDVATGDTLVDTRTALVQASVKGSVRLTRAMWARLDAVFFVMATARRHQGPGRPVSSPRRWRAAYGPGKTALPCYGEDVPTTIKRGGRRFQVVVPKWTPAGVRYLREWLIRERRQAELIA